MKTCITCNKALVGRQKMYCSRKCHNKNGNFLHQNYEMQKEKGMKRKAKLVELSGGQCSRCGYKNNYAGLIFHHKNPKEKDFGLDSRKCANSSFNKLLLELEKCILLCHNCHMEIHHPDLGI